MCTRFFHDSRCRLQRVVGISVVAAERQIDHHQRLFARSDKPVAGIVSAGTFGSGFTLRLARSEARAAGGMLERVDDALMLELPLLTDDNS